MPRCNARRQREREHLPPALSALIQLIPPSSNAYTYLCTHYVVNGSNVAGCQDGNVARHGALMTIDATWDEKTSNSSFLPARLCSSSAPAATTYHHEDSFLDDVVIEAAGLNKLVAALGPESCPHGVADVLRITRRSRRSRSTHERVYVHELCFALSQATIPLHIHTRRRVESESAISTEELEKTPLLQYYQGTRFGAMISPYRCHTHRLHDAENNLHESVSNVSAHVMEMSCGRARTDLQQDTKTCCSTITIKETLDKLDQTEWARFVQSMVIPLPMSLRVHHSESALRWIAQKELRLLCRAPTDSAFTTSLSPVRALAAAAEMYTCSHSVYHSDVTLQSLCRTLHAAGAVSFQEVVSAIPVLVLNIQPHHRVLDMCASPGSKTLHALDEMLGANFCGAKRVEESQQRVHNINDMSPSERQSICSSRWWSQINDSDDWTQSPSLLQGVVVANEKDRVKATQLLPARLKRYHAPNVMCTRCDATQWPRLFVPRSKMDMQTNNVKESNCRSVSTTAHSAIATVTTSNTASMHASVGMTTTATATTSTVMSNSSLAKPTRSVTHVVSDGMDECLFDRVLCDVPCSGDGTLRKDVSVASTWGASYVHSLVTTQKALLRRGLDMLRVGGLLVYSTCSLNPAEDEEVVCSALEVYGDCVQLIDVNATLRQRGADWHSRGGLHRCDVNFRGSSSATKHDNKPCSSDHNNDNNNVASVALLSSYASHPTEVTLATTTEEDDTATTQDGTRTHDESLCAMQTDEPPMGYDGTKVLRVMPHRDDTGGFFVAAFRKLRLPDWTPPACVARKLNQWMQSKLWAPVKPTDPAWRSIVDFYGLSTKERTTFSYWNGGVISARRAGTGECAHSTAVTSSLYSSCSSDALTSTKSTAEAMCNVSEKEASKHNAQPNNYGVNEEGVGDSGGLVPVYHLNPHDGQPRRVVLTTPAAAQMLFATLLYKGPGVELVSVGMRAFELYDARYLVHAACRWRVVAEAASFLAPRCTARCVRLSTRTHGGMLEELFRHGYVSLREHWCALLLSCSHSLLPSLSKLSSQHRNDVFLDGTIKDSTSVLPQSADCRYSLLRCGSTLAHVLDAIKQQQQVDRGGSMLMHADCVPANVEELLMSDLRVGGVLLEVVHEDTDATEDGAVNGDACDGSSSSNGSDRMSKGPAMPRPWVLSATLSANKLELTIDASLRAFGLSVYIKKS